MFKQAVEIAQENLDFAMSQMDKGLAALKKVSESIDPKDAPAHLNKQMQQVPARTRSASSAQP